MTKASQYRKMAENPSLPASARLALIEMAERAEASEKPPTDLLYNDEAPKPEKKATAKKPAKATAKAKPEKKATAKKPAKAAPKQKPATTGPAVDRTSPATKFIKLFLGLANRSVPTRRVVNYLKRLQRAILAQEIRKSSKYSNLVAWIQASLVQTLQTYSSANINLELKGADMAIFQDFAADAKAGYLSAKLLKTYVGSQDGYLDQQKLDSLAKRMQTALTDGSIGPGDPFKPQVERALVKLKKQDPTARIAFSEAELKGLGCLCQGK
jgi:hypothetical protein